jgi:small GTP-binding protein
VSDPTGHARTLRRYRIAKKKFRGMNAEKQLNYKAILIGDSSVGKTSIMHMFQEHTFKPTDGPTVGASFLLRAVHTTRGRIILNLWDTAGQECYRSLIPTYARGARAVLLVFDATSPRSFESLAGWLSSLQFFCSPDCALFVVGNKTDLGEQIPRETAKSWASEVNAQCHFTSALTGTGINELFTSVAEALASLEPSDTTRKFIDNAARDSCC